MLATNNKVLAMYKGSRPSTFGSGAEIVSPAVFMSNHNTKPRVDRAPSISVWTPFTMSGPNQLRPHHPRPPTTSKSTLPMSASTEIASSTQMSEWKGAQPDHAPLSDSMIRRVRWVTSAHIENMAGEAENPNGKANHHNAAPPSISADSASH